MKKLNFTDIRLVDSKNSIYFFNTEIKENLNLLNNYDFNYFINFKDDNLILFSSRDLNTLSSIFEYLKYRFINTIKIVKMIYNNDTQIFSITFKFD